MSVNSDLIAAQLRHEVGTSRYTAKPVREIISLLNASDLDDASAKTRSRLTYWQFGFGAPIGRREKRIRCPARTSEAQESQMQMPIPGE